MEPVAILVITLVLITLLAFSRKVPVFLVLIAGALFFGLAAGFHPESVMKWIVTGMGNIFSAFAIIILSGIVIVRLLSEQGLLEVIASDIGRVFKNPRAGAGLLGFVLSVPTTCCITTYMMVAPVLKGTEEDRKPLYLVAIGSIISYVLIFPTPVTIPLLENIAPGLSAGAFDTIAIPLSIVVLAVILLLFGTLFSGKKNKTGSQTDLNPEFPLLSHTRAWAPFAVMIAAIPVGYIILGFSHAVIMQFIMLAGLVTALALAPESIRLKGFSAGAKLAGLILFDFCSAGALGNVIISSGLSEGITDAMIAVMPDIIVPFLIAAIFATAQGSRVVTAVISSQIIGASGLAQAINPIPLVLAAAAGTCFISYLTDPYFWLVQRTTGDGIGAVIKNYTLPVAVAGVLILAATVLLTVFFFPYVEDAALAFSP